MIKSFRSKALQSFFEAGVARKLRVQNVRRLGRILNALDAATMPDDMNIPGLRFHSLSGDQKGRYAVDASGNWRVTFGWDGEDAIDIDLEDYH